MDEMSKPNSAPPIVFVFVQELERVRTRFASNQIGLPRTPQGLSKDVVSGPLLDVGVA